MYKNVFTLAELENAFEIGRFVQYLIDNGSIEVADSKDAFVFAQKLAIEFEQKYPDTEEYYSDIQKFVSEKLLEEFGE